MNPKQQKKDNQLKNAEAFIEKIESVLTFLIVIIFILLVLQYTNGFIKRDVMDILHVVEYLLFGLRVILYCCRVFLRLINNKFRWLMGVIRIITNGKNLDDVNVFKEEIKSANGESFQWKYPMSNSDLNQISKLDIEMFSSDSVIVRNNYYENLLKKRSDLIAAMYKNDIAITSVTAFPMKNLKNYNSYEFEIINEDISETTSNVINLNILTINYRFIDSVTIRAFMSLVCYHIASLACTKDGTYTDILIYSRVKNGHKVVFQKMLKEMGFVKLDKMNGESIFVLKFSDEPSNVYVQKIFELMKGNICGD